MALGMKHWLGIVGAGVALAAIMGLPPAAIDVRAFGEKTAPEEARLSALLLESSRLNGTLRIRHYMATMAPATVATPEGLVIRSPSSLGAERTSLLHAEVRRELLSSGVTTRRVSLGVFVMDPNEGTHAAAPGGRLVGHEYYWGVQGGRPYCFTALPAYEVQRRPRESSLLGVCELVAKYGLPGPTMQGWLATGGISLATTATPSRPIDLVSSRAGRARVYRGTFGRAQYIPWGPSALPAVQCWAEEAVGCAQLIIHPPHILGGHLDEQAATDYFVAHTPLSAVDYGTSLPPRVASVMADLSNEFGDARFETFWKTDQPFADGFQAAFGTDLGQWSFTRLRDLFHAQQPGPAVGLDEKLSTALLLALSAVIGGLWATRRRVT